MAAADKNDETPEKVGAAALNWAAAMLSIFACVSESPLDQMSNMVHEIGQDADLDESEVMKLESLVLACMDNGE